MAWKLLSEKQWKMMSESLPVTAASSRGRRPRADNWLCFEGILWILWKRDGVYQVTLSCIVPKSVDSTTGWTSRFHRLTNEELAELLGAVPRMKPEPMEEETATMIARHGSIKISSNTIRIGIGEIPEGELDERPLKDEKPVEETAPSKIDEVKSSPPVKPEDKNDGAKCQDT